MQSKGSISSITGLTTELGTLWGESLEGPSILVSNGAWLLYRHGKFWERVVGRRKWDGEVGGGEIGGWGKWEGVR